MAKGLLGTNYQRLANFALRNFPPPKLAHLGGREYITPKRRQGLYLLYKQQKNCQQRVITSWWFQPLWKILVKMGIFPK